jgi:hypothetical protein
VAERNPPLYTTNSLVFDASDLGLPWRDVFMEGVVGSADLKVSQRAAGANMSVDVAAGACWVLGDDNTTLQPQYRVVSDSVVNLAVAAADATNPRKDIVIAEVLDAEFSGASRLWRLRYVVGTPAGSPAEPAVPNNAVKLALVDVPAADTSITTSQVTDRRTRSTAKGVPRLTVAEFQLLGAAIENHPAPGQFSGMVVTLEVDAANHIYWRLRYNATATTYKWECIGGAPVIGTNETLANATTTSYADTGQPVSVTSPLVGIFDVRLDCGVDNAAEGDSCSIVITDLGNAILSADPLMISNNGRQAPCSRLARVTLTDTANKGFKMRAKVGASQTGGITRKTLTVMPVAVGIT